MMVTSPTPQTTDFTRDVVGRYICNGLDEALRSTDPTVLRPWPDARPQIEARPFDIIVIGGGTFGAVVAEHIAFRDLSRDHRILVLEGGPLMLGEHVQNMPVLGLNPPGPSSIQDLRADNQYGPDKPRNEVWGLPWHAPVKFPGLAYSLGGRSLYWGGWSPELLDTETASWPPAVVNDLRNRYLAEASAQIGVTETNDFIFGLLHSTLRQRLFAAVSNGQVGSAVALGQLPDHPALRYIQPPPDLATLLGRPPASLPQNDPAGRNELKLEAPLAVQGASGHAGFFPFNKFSTVPLLVKAAREAAAEAGRDDARKRLMVVPQCHVIRLDTVRRNNQLEVFQVITNQGVVPVPPGGNVIVALGTIESTRLVAATYRRDLNDVDTATVGQNLMAHLRSNLDIRVPASALGLAAGALQASALFVKGRQALGNNVTGHYHLQITASGLGARGGNSEAELFKKIPDIDTYDRHRNANDTHVAITIRGIGEMQPNNPDNFVRLDNEVDENGESRAFVSLPKLEDSTFQPRNPLDARDQTLWAVMDQAAQQVAIAFGVAQPPPPNRDGLGTTHHETGPLAMGPAASNSPTMPDGRLRHTTNVYAVGPAVFPTIGSPNPMLTGVALARRMGDALGSSQRWPGEASYTTLFDGTNAGQWRMTTIRNQPAGRDDPGSMRILRGALETVPGNDMGIFWCTTPMPADFLLKLEFLRWSAAANSGVYLRFPDPESKNYNNTAYVADDFGFEVQIDDQGDVDVHRTGAIYRKDNRTDGEVLNLRPSAAPGAWSQYEIEVVGQQYTVKLDGNVVCTFNNTMYPGRGAPSTQNAPTFIGLQVYPTAASLVAFRRIRFRPLP
jgi:choline dehydrogenase-like flavoprotein